MDILQTLDTEMKGKNWSLEEKKRHLYLQSCMLFTYDTRYRFVSSKNTIKNASNILKAINSRDIDLSNVTDFRINCYSWSNTFKKILKELLSVDSTIEEDPFGTHAWVISGNKADATEKSDLTRVKMNLCTIGYYLSINEEEFVYDVDSPKKIKIMDKHLGYIDSGYCNLEPLIEHLKLEFKDLNLSNEEAFFWWMNQLQKTYQSFQKNLPYFEDASFAISYLFGYFFDEDILENVEYVTLFDDTNEDYWNFIDIYRICYLGNKFYYALIKKETGYDFIEISSENGMNLIANFQHSNKEFILKRKILQ